MAKSKAPPEMPDKFELLMTLAPLCMELYDLMRTSNDLDDMDPVSSLVLATVTVGDGNHQPMTAEEMAFFLGTPLRTVNSKLKKLMKTGVIEADGDRYRYIQPRKLTHEEKRRTAAIKRAFDELRPTLKKLTALNN
jgi:predicted transcriptional regulator